MQPDTQFVNKELEAFYEQFSPIAEKELITFFDQNVKEISRLVNAYKSRFENLSASVKEEPVDIKHFKEYNNSLLELLEKYQNQLMDFNYENVFADYFKLLDEHADGVSVTLKRKETAVLYQFSRKDNIGKLITKAKMNSAFLIFRQGKKASNLFRKIRKLPPESIEQYRIRKVPFRNMVAIYVGNRLIKYLSKYYHETIKRKSGILLKLWKFDEEFDLKLQSRFAGENDEKISEIVNVEGLEVFVEQLKAEMSNLRKDVKIWVTAGLLESFQKLDKAMQIVDTPDLPTSIINQLTIAAEKELVMRNLLSGIKNWNNTQNTLYDDWGVDVEIVLLYYSVLVHSSELQLKIETFIKKQLSVNFIDLETFINASGERISKNSTSSKKLELALTNERNLINSELIDNMLSKMIEKLSGSFIDDLESFRNKTLALVSKVTDRRGFIKGKDYERGVKDSEINYISPRELLSFEALPHFEIAITDVKNLVSSSMEKVRLKLLAMGTVCDFSLESAGMFLQQKKNSVKSAEKVALEGYERALSLVGEAVSLAEKIRTEPLEKIESAIHEFNAEIQELKNTENILELNIRIARIRALEKSKKVRKDAVLWVRNIIPEIQKYLTVKFKDANLLVEGVKNRIGISSDNKQISFEVSEFLSQTEAALKKLPFVYQRLYQIKPTDEERFFVSRKEELEMLEQAYHDWSIGRFVLVSVMGEKGSGITSFLSFFKRKNIIDYPVIHESPENKIYLPEQYYNFFAQILEVEKFESNQEIINYINNLNEQKVIILENLHHFFLKKVNGMDCQKMLFEMMSNTTKKIFWIGTYTIHSWDYLDKAISVSDYFVRNIRLQSMTSVDLMEIIYKRNNLSGYKVLYEPPEDMTESRAFSKMNEDEQQLVLKNHYFTNLTNLSNGNVSLAQLYWLRSTREVTEDTISIGLVYEIDLSFVKEIKSEYLFALYTLLVHDGLTLNDYAMVFNLSESGCRNILIPMLEKGLLIRPKQKFNINPIIFRQVVNYLRSRNFLS